MLVKKSRREAMFAIARPTPPAPMTRVLTDFSPLTVFFVGVRIPQIGAFCAFTDLALPKRMTIFGEDIDNGGNGSQGERKVVLDVSAQNSWN